MSDTDHDLARRTVLMERGFGPRSRIGVRACFRSRPRRDPSRRNVRRDLELRLLGQQGQREAQPLAQARGPPRAGEQPRPVLFLVHGSSNSTRSSFDLHVPGKGEYSLMNVMARYGYDVWTMDHDGYGRSGSSGNNSDIASGVEDLKAAIPVVLGETGQSKMHFYGTSSGAIRAGAYAQVQPERVDRLVLVAFTYKGTGSPEIGRRAQVVEGSAPATAASATPP